VDFAATVQSAYIPRESCVGGKVMSDSTRPNRLQSAVGLVAEYLVMGLIMLMTLVSTLRMLGILS
jgi:hypothetical protein